MSRIARALASPGEAWRVVVALGRGLWIKAWYRLTRGRRVSIGPSFRAYCWLTVRGPGTVRLGRKVSVGRGFQRKPSILTHTKDACVTVGDESFLGGARISAAVAVTVGEETLLGSVTLIDSDVIPAPGQTLDEAWLEAHTGPITVGSRCWMGTNAFVLRDAVLGDECVVAAGSVIRDRTAKDGVLLVGNPARPLGSTRR